MSDAGYEKKVSRKKISNAIVKAVEEVKKDTRPVLGGDYFHDVFAVVQINAARGTGKTTIIYTILKNCIDKDTKVLLFVGSLYNDSTWKAITDELDKRGITWVGETSLLNEDGKDQLQAWIDDQAKKDEPEEEVKQEGGRPPGYDDPFRKLSPDILLNLMQSGGESGGDPTAEVKKPKKPKKKKYQVPEWCIVLDDLGDEMRRKSVENLCKKNRHFKSLVILSAHSPKDLPPGARNQITNWIFPKGHALEFMEKIHENMGSRFKLDNLIAAYKAATADDAGGKHNFLWLDVPRGEIRRNFNEVLEIE